MGTTSFPGVKSGWIVTLTPHLLLVPCHERVELYLYSPMGFTACTESQCLYKGALYLTYLYMFRHYHVILREFAVSTLLSYTSISMQLLVIQFKI